MEDLSIKKIIYSFFDKDLSKDTQQRFRWWFQNPDNQQEKIEAMQSLWDSSPSVISEQTYDDLEKIKERIRDDEAVNRKLSLRPFIDIRRYAAIVIAIIISSAITYYFTQSHPLEYAQFAVPYGACQKIVLDDGSEVWVNAGSTLIYPKEFNSDTRTVFLTGEANFKVTKNPKKPFIVQTRCLAVQALGTKFGIQAYPNSPGTTATLIEGSIKVETGLELNKKPYPSYILKPNDQLEYSSVNHQANVRVVDAEKLSAWENGYLFFQGATFEQIATTLERKYNVNINFDYNAFKNRSYYVKFNPNESLAQVLSILSQLGYQFKYKIDHKTVFVYAK